MSIYSNKELRWVGLFIMALLLSPQLQAQEQDSTNVSLKKQKNHKKDSIKPDFSPVSFRVGTDMIGIVKSIIDSDKVEFDISTDVVFHKYLFNIELGHFEVDRSATFQGNNALLPGEQYRYTVSGNYLRFGPDINVLKNDPDRSVLFFGLRYGISRFTDEITFIRQDDVWPGGDLVAGSKSNAAVRAGWFEVVTGLKVKVMKAFWLGYTARLKFALDLKGDEGLAPFDVPGFGRAAENSYWGFNYYVFYTIPFKKGRGMSVTGKKK